MKCVCVLCVLESMLAHVANMLMFSNSCFASREQAAMAYKDKYNAGTWQYCETKQEASEHHTRSYGLIGRSMRYP